MTVPVLALPGAEDAGSTPEEMAVIHDRSQRVPGCASSLIIWKMLRTRIG
jgi:hypothetical protein